MQQPEFSNEPTILAWAGITINIRHNKIVELKAWDTRELYNSFRYDIYNLARNSVVKIEFCYHLYDILTWAWDALLLKATPEIRVLLLFARKKSAIGACKCTKETAKRTKI